MEPIQKGKQTNKTSNMCASDKGKQTNKQTSGGSTCGGTDAGGSVELCNMQSLVCNVSEYAEELQRCIGDASEKRGVRYTGLYSDTLMENNRPWQVEQRWCRPAWQGLVQKSMKMPHLEMCSMQPVAWMKAEPSMAIPAVHIAPPGTNAGMLEWWLGGCLCINWQKDG